MNRKQLYDQIKAKRSMLCVGLDVDFDKMPEHIKALAKSGEVAIKGELFKGKARSILSFNKAIIDATAPHCVAYKPNLAFYECYGLDGMRALDATVDYIRTTYPEIFLIADAKRGDIGNTAKMYAKAFFESMDFDAVTLAPYMGEDSVTPFLGYEGKWVILLALTSNKGSMDFQFSCDENGERLFEKVLKTSQKWGNDKNMMYVVGATQGKMFEDIRRLAPHHFLLVPGVGAQGWSLQEVCKYGMTSDCELLVNSSRGIIYASNGTDFAEIAAQKAKDLQQEMAVELDKQR